MAEELLIISSTHSVGSIDSGVSQSVEVRKAELSERQMFGRLLSLSEDPQALAIVDVLAASTYKYTPQALHISVQAKLHEWRVDSKLDVEAKLRNLVGQASPFVKAVPQESDDTKYALSPNGAQFAQRVIGVARSAWEKGILTPAELKKVFGKSQDAQILTANIMTLLQLGTDRRTLQTIIPGMQEAEILKRLSPDLHEKAREQLALLRKEGYLEMLYGHYYIPAKGKGNELSQYTQALVALSQRPLLKESSYESTGEEMHLRDIPVRQAVVNEFNMDGRFGHVDIQFIPVNTARSFYYKVAYLFTDRQDAKEVDSAKNNFQELLKSMSLVLGEDNTLDIRTLSEWDSAKLAREILHHAIPFKI